jgi:hypothetical protein
MQNGITENNSELVDLYVNKDTNKPTECKNIFF